MSSATASPHRRADRALVIVEALVGLGVVAAVVGKSYGTASTVTFLLAGLALAFTSLVVVRMFSALRDETLDVPGAVTDRVREELEEEKLILLQGIKEFEADAAQGKVDAADYESLRKTAEARAVEILKTLQATDALYLERAEKLVAQRTGGYKLKTAAPATAKAAAQSVPVAEDSPSKNVHFLETDGRLVCSHCGAQNEDDGRFCVGCGRPREESLA